MSTGYVVTRAERETLQVETGAVEVVPAWWLLLRLEQGGVPGAPGL